MLAPKMTGVQGGNYVRNRGLTLRPLQVKNYRLLDGF